ncbi:regulatory protein, tetR family [Amycolatopsis lurida]|uniref:TetR family transcriptional regulator n=1 Tax=Amycolatopsis lurida NRRL 2430 TaxID=1460371 RepID=A0A2P2FT00_AMYLU|nr:TetR/AcrR family transcriptional regulator [Amycolatopsis lurida]KFU79846.1 TetR family transcriptional regulator [Amycolatopsis lurida NRRL 2430]SED79434.1 regulatory protein, tetR family [Amycolatopsis lurida]
MTDEGDAPATLMRLWRRAERPTRGRPSVLDIDSVVAAAVDLADREGVANVTLASVAKDLGVTKMSLYRHIGSKAELLELMADFAIGDPPRVESTGQWRAELTRLAEANRDVLMKHPWLVELPLTGPPAGPHAVAWMDAILRTLRDTGLDWGTKGGILVLVGGYVRLACAQAIQLAEGRKGRGLSQAQAEQAYGKGLAALIDPERFPDAAGFLASGLGDSGQNSDFDFGLGVVLDGIAALVDAS